MRRWNETSVEAIFEHRIFRLEKQRLSAEGASREALVLRAPDWVNVIALDSERRVLLVRQWRFGTAEVTLEVPGGMIDPGETPVEAAARELREETGYAAREWTELGRTEPNPAFLSNTCISFLARGLERLGEPTGDGEEELILETAGLDEIPDLIRSGEIRHALVLSAFHWLGLRHRLSPRDD